jgi:hypothetical protein
VIDRSKIIIVGILLLSALAAGGGVWFRYQQSRRALALWGPEHAARIRNAAAVEAWRIEAPEEGAEPNQAPEQAPDAADAWLVSPEGAPLAVAAQRRLDAIADLIHIRKAFLDDIHFLWDAPTAPCAPQWTYVVRFEDEAGVTTLWIDEACDVVHLAETGARQAMNPPLLRSVRERFLKYHLSERAAPQRRAGPPPATPAR